jgi:PAS domain S-box-containing protein
MNSCINQYNVLNGFLLENIPDTIFIMHRDGTVLEIHGANPDILTAPACDLIGANINETFGEEEVSRHLDLYNKCIKSGETGLIEYKLNIKNKELYFESKVKALDNERLLTIVRDITTHKELLKSYKDESTYREFLFENIKDGLVLLDENHKVISTNIRMCEMLGYTSEELLNLYTWDFDAILSERDIKSNFSLSGEINYTFESRHRRKDGLCYDVEVSAKNAIWQGNKVVFCVCRDISERKMLEKHREIALKKADEIGQRFEQIAEHVGEFIWEVDSKGNYTYVNRAATSILGYSQEEIVGKMSCFDLMPENERQYLECAVYELFDKRENINNLENVLIAKDGRCIYVITNGIPITSSSGELIGYRGSDRDITQEKKNKEQLELSGERYRHLLHNLHAGVVVHAADSSIIFSNQKAADLLGLSADQMKGLDAYDSQWRFVDANGDVIQYHQYPVSRVISSGSYVQNEVFGIERMDKNERVWVQVNAFPEYDANNTLLQIVVTFIDITEQTRLYQDLLISKKKAEESSRLKSEFINNISHEIRTPLNGILGFVEIIMSDEDLKRSRQDELSILYMSSKRLQKTVDDIMTISELTSGTITPNIESFDLCLLICELFERTTLLCSKKGILSCTDFPSSCEELILRSDPELLKNALWQLLENAVKFTHHGCITVGFTIDNEMVTLFVKDTGVGISRALINNIFDPFMQEDASSTRGYEGSGLGLPISKGIIELLNGQVWVESEKNIGSTFYLSLPLPNEKRTPEMCPLKVESFDVSSGRCILIAEDDDYNYLYINTILQRAGYCTLHAINGAEAVMMCRQNDEISMVFMDIKMPVMNGLEAIKRVKEIKPHLPLIATTAYVQVGDKQRFISAGCDDYLPKPMKVSEILAMVNKYMPHIPAK